MFLFFFFKQKTAYDMRISDWSSDVCSSDLCCDGYADYLRQNGFTVTVKATHDLAHMSRAAGIPDDYQGCHLSQIDGYVVSGHVPVETVNLLLSERPDIAGITLPGMPMGSPGMSGVKTEPFTIYEIGGKAPETYAVE